MFGSTCYILADKDQIWKLYHKSDEGIFMGYSINSRAYHVFNNNPKSMMESINIIMNKVQSKVTTHEGEDFAIPACCEKCSKQCY